MPRASNLAILIFLTTISISGIIKVVAHNFMKSRSRDGLAAKGLFLRKVPDAQARSVWVNGVLSLWLCLVLNGPLTWLIKYM